MITQLDRDNLDNVPEAGGDEVSREPELGVVLLGNVDSLVSG